jgi:hypothetical protein
MSGDRKRKSNKTTISPYPHLLVLYSLLLYFSTKQGSCGSNMEPVSTRFLAFHLAIGVEVSECETNKISRQVLGM